MDQDAHLRLGYISFINSVPFFACLKESGFQGTLSGGVPSVLNRMLQDGKIDVSPSSSFEYARNWRDYLILPRHSIASYGPVDSVLLFSPVPLEQLEKKSIFLTGESATSINLLRILLKEYIGLQDVNYLVPERRVEQMIAEGEPALLIGDRALIMADAAPRDMQIYDLGELWTRFTDLPFVFALWMIRRDAIEKYPRQLTELGSQLMASRDQVLAYPERYAQRIAEKAGFDIDRIISYWQTIDYRLDVEHQQGLKLFFDLCVKHGLLSEDVEINFYQ